MSTCTLVAVGRKKDWGLAEGENAWDSMGGTRDGEKKQMSAGQKHIECMLGGLS